MAALVLRESVNDLWARAAAQLPDGDKQNINFNNPDKLRILVDLHADAESYKRRSVESRWKYTRKNGQTVILRDVFDKIIRWIDVFKQVGDIAVQYDQAHASLPWAGVRLILQIAVNDSTKLSLVIEGLALVAELICRHAIIEALYLQSLSEAAKELERAVVNLYASILGYLSKAKQYFDQPLAKRIIKSALITEAQLDSGLNDIRTAANDISLYTSLVDRNDEVKHHSELRDLLTGIDIPLRRMADDLKNIHDKLGVSKRTKIIQWLSPEPYKQHHAQARQGVLKGTGDWLLSDPIFKQWKNDSASSILWLHGIPGSGKSKLVSIVIEEALKSSSAGNIPQPVFFYCSRNPVEPTRSEPRAILASLARQLSCVEPGKPLLRPSLDFYKKREEEGFASGSLQMGESRALILQLIEQYPLTTIVIDAMDECHPQKRRELLEALEEILRDSASLVKIFVSSRNDQDIVLRLHRYPNLEIDSQKNSDDIARFVKDETERLIQRGELLQYSNSQEEMKELIVRKVIKGAAGMFRWASMQLQYLCSFILDADIKSSLGRLPPDLHTLYAELYEMLSTKPGKFEAMIFMNVLHWLLCAQRVLKTEEFLHAISIDPHSGNIVSLVSKNHVLKICNNFIVFDLELDTFRFAHLSVREFLEQRPEYNIATTNALAAEVCLRAVLSTDSNTELVTIEGFRAYADIYWGEHCKSARSERSSGRLKKVLDHFLSGSGEADSSITLWNNRLEELLLHIGFGGVWLLLEDLRPTANFSLCAALLVSCVFDFEEQIEAMVRAAPLSVQCINGMGRSLVHIAVRHGSCASLACLLEQDPESTKITEEIVMEAVWHWCSSKELMALLLTRRGNDVQITEGMLIGAASHSYSGKELMMLLLDWQGDDVQITEEVLITAAMNKHSGKDTLALLLDRQGDDIQITREVLFAAARNKNSGKDILALLLDRRGHNEQITEELLIEAIQNDSPDVIALFLDGRGYDVQINQKMIIEAARNVKPAVIELLLDRGGVHVQITEKVLKASTRNRHGGEVMIALLNQRWNDVQITEKVMKAAATSFVGSELLEFLLKRDPLLSVTQEVIDAALSTPGCLPAVKVLFEQRPSLPITEDILKAVATNQDGKQVLGFLLSGCPSSSVTEEVLKAAAINPVGKQVLEFLLERDPSLSVTPDVLNAAARGREAMEVVEFLLERDLWLSITEEVLKAATCSPKAKNVLELLLEEDPSLSLTQEVLKVAACSAYNERAIEFLLRRDRSLSVTEEVLKAAAYNPWGARVLKILLKGDPSLSITEEIVKAAAYNRGGRRVLKFLFQRYPSLSITEDVIIAAACNHTGKQVVEFLFSLDASISITEEQIESINDTELWNDFEKFYVDGGHFLGPTREEAFQIIEETKSTLKARLVAMETSKERALPEVRKTDET